MTVTSIRFCNGNALNIYEHLREEEMHVGAGVLILANPVLATYEALKGA